MPNTDYATVADMKAAGELNGTSYADGDIARAVDAASRGIDGICKRRFWLDDDAEQIRYFSPRSRRLLSLDDLVELTEFAVGTGDTFTAWTENTDFILGPLNADADGKPYQSIRALRALPCGTRTVRVTGRFGWPEIPARVQQATMILAAKLVLRSRQAPLGVISFPSTGEVTRIATTDPDIAFLLGGVTRRLVR